MKITAYYPVLFANDLNAAMQQYEKLGFKHLHTLDDGWVKLHILEINGDRIDIFTSELPELQMKDGFYAMRVNVREFEEGLAFYQEQGYKILMGPASAPSMQLAVLANDDGNRIFLFHHIKKQPYMSDKELQGESGEQGRKSP